MSWFPRFLEVSRYLIKYEYYYEHMGNKPVTIVFAQVCSSFSQWEPLQGGSVWRLAYLLL